MTERNLLPLSLTLTSESVYIWPFEVFASSKALALLGVAHEQSVVLGYIILEGPPFGLHRESDLLSLTLSE